MPITLERRAEVAILRMDRPDRRNAIDPEMSRAMNAAVVELDGDPAVRAIVVTGNGPVFCAGADLAAIADGKLREIIDAEPGGFAGLVRSSRTTPVIAAVNGPALAGGFEIVLACDLAVAAGSATFGLPEVKRGIIAGAGGLIRLPLMTAPRFALELTMTGEAITAARALELGLLNRVVPDGQELDAALELATAVAANAPVAVRESRAVMSSVVFHGEAAAWEANERAWDVVLASADAQEGPRAFAEKRPAQWTGR